MSVLTVWAAGSLKQVFGDLAALFETGRAERIDAEFGPSGVLCDRIEQGARPHLFASADMHHLRRLEQRGIGGPVVAFARNDLCLLARRELQVRPQTVLDTLLDPHVSLGTSTPHDDPSGNYAWALFERAGVARPGAFPILENKAAQLTGRTDAPQPPQGRNPYGWIVTSGLADVFITYRTNALAACRENPELDSVDLPADLAVQAEYGIIEVTGAPRAAGEFTAFLLSDGAQDVLGEYGFAPPA